MKDILLKACSSLLETDICLQHFRLLRKQPFTRNTFVSFGNRHLLAVTLWGGGGGGRHFNGKKRTRKKFKSSKDFMVFKIPPPPPPPPLNFFYFFFFNFLLYEFWGPVSSVKLGWTDAYRNVFLKLSAQLFFSFLFSVSLLWLCFSFLVLRPVDAAMQHQHLQTRDYDNSMYSKWWTCGTLFLFFFLFFSFLSFSPAVCTWVFSPFLREAFFLLYIYFLTLFCRVVVFSFFVFCFVFVFVFSNR